MVISAKITDGHEFDEWKNADRMPVLVSVFILLLRCAIHCFLSRRLFQHRHFFARMAGG